MITLDAKKIIGNKSSPWFHAFVIEVNHKEARNYFQVAPVVADEDGLGEFDYWALKFDCGLVLCFEFSHHIELGSVYANMPSSQHAHRHLKQLGFNDSMITRHVNLADEADMVRQFKCQLPELLESECYQLWRQGDDGNPIQVGLPTTRLDAECWLKQLEFHQHKQTYWISKVDD